MSPNWSISHRPQISRVAHRPWTIISHTAKFWAIFYINWKIIHQPFQMRWPHTSAKRPVLKHPIRVSFASSRSLPRSLCPMWPMMHCNIVKPGPAMRPVHMHHRRIKSNSPTKIASTHWPWKIWHRHSAITVLPCERPTILCNLAGAGNFETTATMERLHQLSPHSQQSTLSTSNSSVFSDFNSICIFTRSMLSFRRINWQKNLNPVKM